MSYTPTAAELDAIERHHLPYELRMLRAAADILGEVEPPEQDYERRTRHYMAIELFYIHFRNLHAFYFESRVKKGDAVASHFLGSARDWRKRYGIKESEKLREAADLADKLVAHLGYSRIQILAAGKGLELGPLLEDIQAVHEAFQQERLRLGKAPIEPRSLVRGTEGGRPPATTISTPASASAGYDLWLRAGTPKEQRRP